MESILGKDLIGILAFKNEDDTLSLIEFRKAEDLLHFMENLEREKVPFILARDLLPGYHIACMGLARKPGSQFQHDL